jgi:hypothetical protein
MKSRSHMKRCLGSWLNRILKHAQDDHERGLAPVHKALALYQAARFLLCSRVYLCFSNYGKTGILPN